MGPEAESERDSTVPLTVYAAPSHSQLEKKGSLSSLKSYRTTQSSPSTAFLCPTTPCTPPAPPAEPLPPPLLTSSSAPCCTAPETKAHRSEWSSGGAAALALNLERRAETVLARARLALRDFERATITGRTEGEIEDSRSCLKRISGSENVEAHINLENREIVDSSIIKHNLLDEDNKNLPERVENGRKQDRHAGRNEYGRNEKEKESNEVPHEKKDRKGKLDDHIRSIEDKKNIIGSISCSPKLDVFRSTIHSYNVAGEMSKVSPDSVPVGSEESSLAVTGKCIPHINLDYRNNVPCIKEAHGNDASDSTNSDWKNSKPCGSRKSPKAEKASSPRKQTDNTNLPHSNNLCLPLNSTGKSVSKDLNNGKDKNSTHKNPYPIDSNTGFQSPDSTKSVTSESDQSLSSEESSPSVILTSSSTSLQISTLSNEKSLEVTTVSNASSLLDYPDTTSTSASLMEKTDRKIREDILFRNSQQRHKDRNSEEHKEEAKHTERKSRDTEKSRDGDVKRHLESRVYARLSTSLPEAETIAKRVSRERTRQTLESIVFSSSQKEKQEDREAGSWPDNDSSSFIQSRGQQGSDTRLESFLQNSAEVSGSGNFDRLDSTSQQSQQSQPGGLSRISEDDEARREGGSSATQSQSLQQKSEVGPNMQARSSGVWYHKSKPDHAPQAEAEHPSPMPMLSPPPLPPTSRQGGQISTDTAIDTRHFERLMRLQWRQMVNDRPPPWQPCEEPYNDQSGYGWTSSWADEWHHPCDYGVQQQHSHPECRSQHQMHGQMMDPMQGQMLGQMQEQMQEQMQAQARQQHPLRLSSSTQQLRAPPPPQGFCAVTLGARSSSEMQLGLGATSSSCLRPSSSSTLRSRTFLVPPSSSHTLVDQQQAAFGASMVDGCPMMMAENWRRKNRMCPNYCNSFLLSPRNYRKAMGSGAEPMCIMCNASRNKGRSGMPAALSSKSRQAGACSIGCSNIPCTFDQPGQPPELRVIQLQCSGHAPASMSLSPRTVPCTCADQPECPGGRGHWTTPDVRSSAHAQMHGHPRKKSHVSRHKACHSPRKGWTNFSGPAAHHRTQPASLLTTPTAVPTLSVSEPPTLCGGVCAQPSSPPVSSPRRRSHHGVSHVRMASHPSASTGLAVCKRHKGKNKYTCMMSQMKVPYIRAGRHTCFRNL